MGIHIILVKIKGTVTDSQGDYLDYDHLKDWDSDRHAGDTQFNRLVEKIQHSNDNELWRPANFEDAEKSIRTRVPNPDRLIQAMERMKADNLIWFKTSY